MKTFSRKLITATISSILFMPVLLTAQELALDSNKVERVTVTGQKIERSLQDTKESVSVITQAMIKNMPVLEVKDLLDILPNTYTIFNGESFGLRGITQNSSSTGGGSGELASLYIDGVAYTGFASRFNSKDLWDVAQVEVLRGPQSTNVGRNALVGALVVKTNRPELDVNATAVKLEAGNFGKLGASAMLNVAITDKSAFRFSGQYNENDGFINNVTLNDDKFDARENTNLRAQYFVELSTKLTANLSVAYTDTFRGQDIYRADLQAKDSFASSANLKGIEQYEATTAALDVEYELTDQLGFSSITSFIEGDYLRFDDDDEGPEGGNAFRGRQATDRNWAQELRLSFNSESLRGVIGGYYTEVDLINNTTGLVNILPQNVGVPATLLPFYPALLEVDVFTPFEQETTNIALFTEWDYSLNDQLTLSAGVRYDDEKQVVFSNVANQLAEGSTLPDPVQSGLIAEQIQAGLGPIVEGGVTQVNAVLLAQLNPTDFPRETFKFDAFLPQVGLTYDVNDDVSVSAFYK